MARDRQRFACLAKRFAETPVCCSLGYGHCSFQVADATEADSFFLAQWFLVVVSPDNQPSSVHRPILSSQFQVALGSDCILRRECSSREKSVNLLTEHSSLGRHYHSDFQTNLIVFDPNSVNDKAWASALSPSTPCSPSPASFPAELPRHAHPRLPGTSSLPTLLFLLPGPLGHFLPLFFLPPPSESLCIRAPSPPWRATYSRAPGVGAQTAPAATEEAARRWRCGDPIQTPGGRLRARRSSLPPPGAQPAFFRGGCCGSSLSALRETLRGAGSAAADREAEPSQAPSLSAWCPFGPDGRRRFPGLRRSSRRLPACLPAGDRGRNPAGVCGDQSPVLSGNKMSVSVHENRKSRASSGSINIYLFHKSSYADSVLTHLNLLRQQRLFTDVLLHAGNRTFPCHRAVLAACSRYFEAMFSGGLKESQDSEVNFDNSIHPEVLELLLDYAYSSRVIINEENAESLLEAGDMLEFQDIRDACAEFLEKNLHPTNCLGMLLLSDAHQCTKLYELSWRMCLSNFQTIRKNEDFLQLPQDMVVQLLSSEELETEDERLVYESAINWISYDLKKRYCYLPELLQTVRLALLPAIYLMENVAMEELITKQRKSKEIVEEAIRCKLKILQNDGVVTSLCARPRKTGHALFLLGGQTFMCDKLYLVDQKAKEIIPKADIPSPRKEFSACAIGCKVYITGGRGSENGVSKDVWVYDTLHEEWSKAAPMLVARFGHGSAELKHCLYVVGGHTAATGCLPASPSVSLKQVEHYDPTTNKWTMVAPLREGVSNAAVVSAKLKLFAFGGTSVSHDKLPKVQCYDQCENRWTVPATCPQPWRYTAAAVLGNQIFIMGGDTEFSACSAYKFNSESYQWTKVGDVTAKRMSCHAVASGNKLYVVGGYFGIQRCKTLDCYDPTLDVWNSITTVPYSLIPTAFVSTWKHLPS